MVPWRGLVVDEAHRLKGVSSKLLESLHQILPLGVMTFGSQHRLLMTGTPLQNNTKELWSLLNFIEPGKFPSLENFQETYEGMDSEYQVRSLQQRLAPHLLRRVKEDVATDIPAKEEVLTVGYTHTPPKEGTRRGGRGGRGGRGHRSIMTVALGHRP